MKDKQGKIIAVFNVRGDILSTFCSKLQGCEKHKAASPIPHFWLLNISHSVISSHAEDFISSHGFSSLRPVILSYSVYARALRVKI